MKKQQVDYFLRAAGEGLVRCPRFFTAVLSLAQVPSGWHRDPGDDDEYGEGDVG
jgi:hypothetical protein